MISRSSRVLAAVATAGVMGGGLVSATAGASAHGIHPRASGPAVTITAELPSGSGAITSSENAGLQSLTKRYESAHPNVTVNWLPNTFGNVTTANAALETQASGGNAPDLVWEQYAATTALPAGIIQNIKPFLEKPNPYAPGNKKWLSLFSKSTIPYMTSANGDMYIILGSNVETGMFYNKADFAKAKIASPPTTWAQFRSDLAKLKKVGVAPFLFADGGSCNISWYERLVASSLLANKINSFDTSHTPVATAKDLVTGIARGVISMNNPAYAAGWQLLGQLKPYLYSGGSSYDVCASVSAASPPLNPESLLIQGKVAVEWGLSSWIPQLRDAGFANKYGVFPEPTITKQSTKYALDTVTTGLIGGPNGPGEWSVTSQQADHSMTSAKTKVVMDFLAWLFAPKHLGFFVKQLTEGGDIPTEPSAPSANVPGLKNLLPSETKVPTVLLPLTTGLISPTSANTASRLIQEYVSGGLNYDGFASQWQSLLTSTAQQWASANNVSLSSLQG